eukprot:g79721.t1
MNYHGPTCNFASLKLVVKLVLGELRVKATACMSEKAFETTPGVTVIVNHGHYLYKYSWGQANRQHHLILNWGVGCSALAEKRQNGLVRGIAPQQQPNCVPMLSSTRQNMRQGVRVGRLRVEEKSTVTRSWN